MTRKLIKTFIILSIFFLPGIVVAQPGISAPIASRVPGKYQLEQIKRPYGMFICFSINTFNDIEWSDGTLLATSYASAEVGADQWIKTAKRPA